jgi:hypothetical protein
VSARTVCRDGAAEGSRDGTRILKSDPALMKRLVGQVQGSQGAKRACYPFVTAAALKTASGIPRDSVAAYFPGVISQKAVSGQCRRRRLFGRVDCLSQLRTRQRLARECADSQNSTVCDKFRRRERCESAILSSCHPICNTALALFAPWFSYTRSIFADSSTFGGWPWRAQ